MRRFNRTLAIAAGLAISATVVAPVSAQESNGPKNIIYMIGDGMGYNHVAYNNLYESGQSKYLVDGEFGSEDIKEQEGNSVQSYEDFNRLSQTTYSMGGSYDPEQAWASHEYVQEGIITDSAAAGTAMATGAKVENGVLGMSNYGHAMENLSEMAIKQGKSAGVVSSVPFSHATPAAFAAHNADRNAYGEIAKEMFESDLSVIMGAGHPLYDDSNNPVATPAYKYIDQPEFDALASGESDWEFMENNEQFEALANGEVAEGGKYFGIPQVASTLQQGRAGDENSTPYSDPMNDVVDLPTMTTGALNVLGQDDDGFSVMIEGGAIDWTGHANQSAREIEEMQDFNASVDAAIEWVETNSNWEETLLIVTADHETGYLSGMNEPEDGKWNVMAGDSSTLPTHEWYSGNHTNQVVPFFFKGAGSEDIMSQVKGTDPVRGDYIDNTDIAKLAKNAWWTDGNNTGGNDDDDKKPVASGSSNAFSGLAGAGIMAAVIGALVALAQSVGVVSIDTSAIDRLIRQFK
ncbi:alkaline phosphatase [Corynebacterium stationis]|uniref:alkaline phosphatase n=1 Tax=Corynebacterium stationis TaxID=1705 RepID=UPI0026F1D6BC|nr:alkaline phosphatase [Corynebacterium stationis]